MKKILTLVISLFMMFTLATSVSAKTYTVKTNPMADLDRNGIVNQLDLNKIEQIITVVQNGGWDESFWTADVNHDGTINGSDALIVKTSVNKQITACHWADADGDRVVTDVDMGMFFSHFGMSTGQHANRYDINADLMINILDIVLAGNQLGNTCS